MFPVHLLNNLGRISLEIFSLFSFELDNCLVDAFLDFACAFGLDSLEDFLEEPLNSDYCVLFDNELILRLAQFVGSFNHP